MQFTQINRMPYNYLDDTRKERRANATYEDAAEAGLTANKVLELGPDRKEAALLYFIDAYELLTAAIKGSVLRTRERLERLYEENLSVIMPTAVGGQVEHMKSELERIIRNLALDEGVALPR